MSIRKHKARQYPQGRISDDDEGALQLGVAADLRTKTVRVNFFGVKVKWFALPRKEALAFAELIRKHALSLPDDPTVNSPPAEGVH